MKKLVLVLSVAGLFAFSSCSKCASCSGSNTGLDGVEYCKGNSIEDLAYEFAESECKSAGGSFEK